MTITEKFKKNPMMYYAMSIVASWAGLGSLMNFKSLSESSGVIPAVIWALFNCLACPLYAMIVSAVPEMRKVMHTKLMMYLIGILTFFQTWTQISGVETAFSSTFAGKITGTIIGYGACIVFIAILFKRGMIRNAITDDAFWLVIYGLLLVATIIAFATTKSFTETAMITDEKAVGNGIYKGILLLAGPFTFPYYYELLNYNEDNEDGTNRVNVKASFVIAGILFAVYMGFAALLTWVEFTPALEFMKAMLLTLLAVSSLSTYLYGTYIAFGRKLGLILNIGTVAFAPFVVPLGVMNIWTIMSELRLPIILAALLVAIGIKIRDKQKW